MVLDNDTVGDDNDNDNNSDSKVLPSADELAAKLEMMNSALLSQDMLLRKSSSPQLRW